MLLEQINQLKERIKRLAQSGKTNSPGAIKACGIRLDHVNQRHSRLPLSERLATSQIMYNELEEVLMRFELLDSQRPSAGPAMSRASRLRLN